MKALKSTICCLLIVILLFSSTPVYSASLIIQPYELRVALSNGINSCQFSVSEGTYDLIDSTTQEIYSSPNKDVNIKVTPIGIGNIQISVNGNVQPKLAGPLVMLRQKSSEELNVFNYNNKRYRSNLLVQNINGNLTIVNLIDVEKYLYGVVGAEIGSNSHDEALKAQAVVSRTYALYYKQNPQLGYDIGISTRWQVYEGYNMELISGERVKAAVDGTKGEVILYDNKLIQAFFHSNSGGYTENGENVWFASLPYIKAVSSLEDEHAKSYSIQNNGWPANTYEWNKSFTKPELDQQIQTWNANHPESLINVGKIEDIQISKFKIDPATREYLSTQTDSGRVTQLDIVGTSNTKSFFRDSIRSVFGLRSTLFNIVFDSTIKVWDFLGQTQTFNSANKLRAIDSNGKIKGLNGTSSQYYVLSVNGLKTINKDFSIVSFEGKGYGHGLGLSQWGARGMAVKGYDYRAIIGHYYNQGKNDGRLIVTDYFGLLK